MYSKIQRIIPTTQKCRAPIQGLTETTALQRLPAATRVMFCVVFLEVLITVATITQVLQSQVQLQPKVLLTIQTIIQATITAAAVLLPRAESFN